MSNIYLIGNVVRMTAAFSVAGTATDPSPVPVCTVRTPSGGSATPAVSKSATGAYFADFTPAESGLHSYRWAGEGTAKSASEATFFATPSRVTA
jgi:hypothetical protein